MALDKKLNIGVSEYNSIPDFLNIGIEFTHKGIIEKDGKRMLRHDVTQPFPISDESVEFIYASHIVEHLSIEDFHFFLMVMGKCMMGIFRSHQNYIHIAIGVHH